MTQRKVEKEKYERRIAEVEKLKKSLSSEILNMHPANLDIVMGNFYIACYTPIVPISRN